MKNSAALLVIAIILWVSVGQQEAVERLRGRVAVVTGASSGMGKEISIQLVKRGVNVVGIARRFELLQNISDSLVNEPGKFYPKRCDVRIEEDVVSTFKWVEDNLGAIAVLVNCAGISPNTDLINGNASSWLDILNTNVLGLSMCTKEGVRNMLKNGVHDGQIIQIGSVAGYYFINKYPGFQMYAASKFAVNSLAENLKRELVSMNSTIRVTCIFPGSTNTPLLRDYMASISSGDLESIPLLEPIDIAEAVIYVLSTSSRAQVANLMLVPVGEDI